MTDLMAYKDERLRPILTRTNREKLIKFSEKVLKFLKIAAPFFVMEIWLTMMVVGIVIPLMVEGITMSNILFWSLLSTFPVLILGYYLGMDLIYIFASIWYLPKYHLDIQTDVIIDRMEQFLTEPEIRDIHVIYLDHVYNQLLIRVKKFDQLSRDIISPARFAMSYSIGFMCFATTQQDNILLRFFVSGTSLTAYIIVLSFLSTACSLSIRRRKMYLLANQLFIKASKQRKGKIRQLFILRKLVKSLGDMNRPTICLTDQSGEDFQPMEFVEFVLNTFSNFTLVAKAFRVHLK